MIEFVSFLFGFTLMVALSALVTYSFIGATYLGRWLGWEFRRGSLAREAQTELARARVRARRLELER